ncbi:MAG: DNA translocase FtsK 4TM domain-containing protein [Armatimonadetes bacterium]|nr:DNA translocase FtsK 4TM domain-containing protein [Armatimonadota bacterium]
MSAKKRSKAVVATKSKAKKSKEAVPSHHRFDIAAISFFALAALSVVALLSKDAGVVGGALRQAFSLAFGKGAWAAPVAFAAMGLMYFRGHSRTRSFRSALGVAMVLLAILGGLAQAKDGDFFDPIVVADSGGYLGALMGALFWNLLGVGKTVAFIAIGAIGGVLTLERPIREILSEAKANASLPPKQEALEERATKKKKALVMMPDDLVDDPTDVHPAVRDFVDEPVAKAKKVPTIREVAPAKPREFNIESSVPKEGYQLPPISLLTEPADRPKRTAQEMQRNIETIEGTLEQFGIDANVVEVATGPTITRYEIQLGPGIRVARIVSLADNIAMDMAASQVRVEAPIPGKAAIGLEIPNVKSSTVNIRELIETDEFMNHPSRLCVALGKDVAGVNRYADLTKMPHLLIAGATNSGKSIGLATLITSLLMRNTPKDVRLVMIDPKRVELTLFDQIPHLLCPVIKDVKEAPGVLRAVWREMDRRYDMLSEKGVRNIDGWNAKASFNDKMPYIVVIIDELADLMIQAKAEVETSIVRLAQLARAVGIHLVIATQRPSVDVITGTIKANIPSRVAFAVASQIDSRTILDQKGADALIGRGDMLYMPIDATKPMRVQGCYVNEIEIEQICTFWRNQESPNYAFDPAEFEAADPVKASGDFGDDVDPMWEEVVRFSVESGQVSTSMIQRKFRLGFQRASRLLDQMEERGIIGPKDGPRPREVLFALADLESLFGNAPRYDMGTHIDDWEEDLP